MGSYKKKTLLWIGPMVASHSDDTWEPSTPHSSWAADQSQGSQRQQRSQGALSYWESSSINWLQPTTPAGPLPRALSSTLANTQGPQKIYTLKRTNSGTTSVPGMSYGYVQQLMGMSLLARPDKTCSIGEGNGKVLQYSCLEDSMNRMKR